MAKLVALPLRAAAAAIIAGGAATGIVPLAATRIAIPSPATRPPLLTASGHLASFRSDAVLREFLKARNKVAEGRAGSVMYDVAPPPPAVAAPAPMASKAEGNIVVTGARAASDNITNTQEADVDEGGIVKKRGDLLVVLRRGRLFTISIANGGMRPIDRIDASPPGVSGGGDWYDEMLLSGDRVVVIGYSYARGGTEVNRFRLSPDGHLRFEDAYHLRSNDYYSSTNYASRLVGNRLVYYTPLYLGGARDPFDQFPAVSRWRGDEKRSPFRRVIGARETYVVPSHRDNPDVELDTLHSVMDCDLTAPVLDCKATAVLGPASRTFYVSGNAVYLWVSDAWSGRARAQVARSYLYRIPFARTERPSAIAARGSPTDQFSFHEDRAHGLIDVLLRRDGGGDWMFNNQASDGAVALLSVPIAAMGDGSRAVSLNHYRPLPSPGKEAWNFHNRFVGNHVLYGGGDFGDGQRAPLIAAGLRGGPVRTLDLPHAVERIDQLGDDGVVIGQDPRGSLVFTAVDLRAPAARLGDAYQFPNAAQGESRSQGFFYRNDSPDGATGVLGLPIARPVAAAWHRFFGSAASMLFLRRDDRRFAPAGELAARVEGTTDDGCKASCVDWYGNARPIFADGRIFALLGYELVEGRMRGRSISEVGRTRFAPSPPVAMR